MVKKTDIHWADQGMFCSEQLKKVAKQIKFGQSGPAKFFKRDTKQAKFPSWGNLPIYKGW